MFWLNGRLFKAQLPSIIFEKHSSLLLRQFSHSLSCCFWSMVLRPCRFVSSSIWQGFLPIIASHAWTAEVTWMQIGEKAVEWGPSAAYVYCICIYTYIESYTHTDISYYIYVLCIHIIQIGYAKISWPRSIGWGFRNSGILLQIWIQRWGDSRWQSHTKSRWFWFYIWFWQWVVCSPMSYRIIHVSNQPNTNSAYSWCLLHSTDF